MERRHVLMFRTVGYARIIELAKQKHYFDSMFVREGYRRKGIATALFRFAISHFGRYPELDIRWQSRVAQRIALKHGYRQVGKSERYSHCNTWRHPNEDRIEMESILTIIGQRLHEGGDRHTTIYYLEFLNGSNFPLQPRRSRA